MSNASLKNIDDVTTFAVKLHKKNGTLFAVQSNHELPFSPERLFCIFDVPEGDDRGHHAHKNCKQAIICVKGQCKVTVDDGSDKSTFMLNSPDTLLYIPPSVWAEQTYLGPDTVVIVLADLLYDEQDYIRDYNEFLRYRGIKS